MRRPTGVLSWMMRIQNQQDLAEIFPDFSLADISSLFMSADTSQEERDEPKKMIDNLDLAEKEYESLLQDHFQTESGEDLTKCHFEAHVDH